VSPSAWLGAPRRPASSVAALAALVAANAVPLVGVLFLGWSLAGVLLVY